MGPAFKSIGKTEIGLILGPVAFGFIMVSNAGEGLSGDARAALASTLWIAVWWVTEAIPIAATALLPILLFPLTGALGLGSTTAAYGSPMIFLFMGGFMIALAIEKWNLHKRIALNIIEAIGRNNVKIIFGFMLATAFISMWISNTATTLMMVPIGYALIKQVSVLPAGDQGMSTSAFGKALMLAIAYAASIGGMATLIGTPTNLVLAGMSRELLGIEISFLQWFMFALPISIVLLVVAWLYLVRFGFALSDEEISAGTRDIKEELLKLGKMSADERAVLLVFLLTAVTWISRSLLLAKVMPDLTDTMIAIAGAIAMFIIPARSKPGSRLLEWENTGKLPWGVILLFGGGLAIATAFKETGLAAWIGNQIKLLADIPFLLMLGATIATVNFLTEITSNVATASMILPVLASLSAVMDVHPFGLMIAASMAASCAFMLPVATPPNAIVFGSGVLRMSDMVRVGFWLNAISIVLLTLYINFLLPLLWEFNLNALPDVTH